MIRSGRKPERVDSRFEVEDPKVELTILGGGENLEPHLKIDAKKTFGSTGYKDKDEEKSS